MKCIIASLVLATTAHATILLDRGTNNFYVTNNVTTGSTALTNNVTNVIASGAFVAGSNAFGVASFAPQVFYTGVTNVVLTGGLTGSLTNGVLTVDGSTAALGVAAPTSGTYVAQSKDGVITWEPVAGIGGSNLAATIFSTTYGVTNTFTVAGRTTQTWTWTGGTTNIMIKAWGAGGYVGNGTAYGSFAMIIVNVTNNMQLDIQVPYAGSNVTNPSQNVSYPGGGMYNTNATTSRSSGGGCAIIRHGTNIVLVAGGGGSCPPGNYGAGSAGWPNGTGVGGGGGTQTSGGVGQGGVESGSFLQGGGGGTSTSTTQYGGGGGYYGGGAGTGNGGGGGSSYFNMSYALFGYASGSGVNSGDVNYSSNYGLQSNNGGVLIITPTP